jgi:hypothetical protein
MICPKCGFENVDTAKRCACGIDLTNPDEPTMGMFNEERARNGVRFLYLLAIYKGCANCLSVFVSSHEGWKGYSIINAAVYFGMAYGLYRKSRACAIILFLWFIAEFVDAYQQGTTPLMSLRILLYYLIAFGLFMGIFATFAMHRFEKEKREKGLVHAPEMSVVDQNK